MPRDDAIGVPDFPIDRFRRLRGGERAATGGRPYKIAEIARGQHDLGAAVDPIEIAEIANGYNSRAAL
jgi:hypothetical protein